MRKLLVVALTLVLVLGVVSTNLWLDLRDQRQRVSGLSTELSDARAALARQAGQPPRTVTLTAPLPAAASAAPATIAARSPVNAASAAEVKVAEGTLRPTASVAEKDLLNDPEYRKARLASIRLDMRRSHPGLAEELGMTEREADQFFTLLAENQLRQNEFSLSLSGTAATSPLRIEQAQRLRDLRQQQEQSVAAAIGANRYALWQQYQQTSSARSQAVSMSTQLAQMGLPVSSAQMKPLTAAVIAHQQRERQDSQLQVMASTFDAMDAQSRARLVEESLRRSEEANRRLLESMTPVLNAQQIAVLREQLESQTIMNSARARLREAQQSARARQ